MFITGIVSLCKAKGFAFLDPLAKITTNTQLNDFNFYRKNALIEFLDYFS